jgi:hypothetical protein
VQVTIRGYAAGPERKKSFRPRVLGTPGQFASKDAMNKRSATDVRTNDTQEMQALQAATTAAAAPPVPGKSDDEKMHIFWRVFGGAILSVAALAAFTLYNTLTSNIAELRSEVSRLNEVKAEAAKKEDVAALRTRADDNRRELDSQKERLSKYRTELDAVNKEQSAATAGVKKELMATEKELQKALAEVREKLARLEGQQTPMKPEKQ